MDYLNAFSGFPGKSRITKVQNFKSLRNNALPELLDGIEKGPPLPKKIAEGKQITLEQTYTAIETNINFFHICKILKFIFKVMKTCLVHDSGLKYQEYFNKLGFF